MSAEIASPRPVPWSVGLVVKNGLKIFSITSSGIPIPLSRIRISIWSPSRLVTSVSVGMNLPAPMLPSPVDMRLSCVA